MVDPARPSRLSYAERDELALCAETARASSHEQLVIYLRLRAEADGKPPVARRARVYLDAELSLRDSLKSFAALLRRIEAAPEDAVIQVKQIVRDAANSAPTAARIVERELTADVVAWTIEGYFAAE